MHELERYVLIYMQRFLLADEIALNAVIGYNRKDVINYYNEKQLQFKKIHSINESYFMFVTILKLKVSKYDHDRLDGCSRIKLSLLLTKSDKIKEKYSFTNNKRIIDIRTLQFILTRRISNIKKIGDYNIGIF